MMGYSYGLYGYYGYYGLAYRSYYSRSYYPTGMGFDQTCKEDDFDCLVDFDALNDLPYEVESTYSLAYGSDDYLPAPGETNYSIASYKEGQLC